MKILIKNRYTLIHSLSQSLTKESNMYKRKKKKKKTASNRRRFQRRELKTIHVFIEINETILDIFLMYFSLLERGRN